MEAGHRRRRLYGLLGLGQARKAHEAPREPETPNPNTPLPDPVQIRTTPSPNPASSHPQTPSPRAPANPNPTHPASPPPPPHPPTRLPSTTTNQHQYLSVRISTNIMNGSRMSILAAPRNLFVVYFWLTEGFFEVMRMTQEATASCAWWLIIAPAVAPRRIMWPHVLVEECTEGPCKFLLTRTSTQNRSAEPSSSQPLTRGR